MSGLDGGPGEGWKLQAITWMPVVLQTPKCSSPTFEKILIRCINVSKE